MEYGISFTKGFKKDYDDLPDPIRNKLKEQLALLKTGNFSHPSLRVKKMKGKAPEKLEASITMKYRMTFQIEGDVIIFRTVGKHDILD